MSVGRVSECAAPVGRELRDLAREEPLAAPHLGDLAVDLAGEAVSAREELGREEDVVKSGVVHL